MQASARSPRVRDQAAPLLAVITTGTGSFPWRRRCPSWSRCW